MFLATFAVACAPAAAQDCGGLKEGLTIESARYVLTYRTQPGTIVIGRHFAVEFVVCPKGGQSAPDSVRVDAFMPEHQHGMNYRAVVKPAAEGRYLANGLMFHMPGRWEFVFEVRGAGKTDRMTHAVILE